MSYILEALRRAEAERDRERGAVPGLHAQPAGPPAAPAVRTWSRAGLMLLTGLVLGVAGAVLLLGLHRPSPLPAAVDLQPPAAAAPASVDAPQAVEPPPLTVVSAPPRLEAVTSAPAPVPASAAAPAAAQAARTTPLAVADLPAELRPSWPALSITGAIYSDSPSSRFIMVAGQVVREGEAAAPGVVVERIRPRSAVLRWKDLRVELPF